MYSYIKYKNKYISNVSFSYNGFVVSYSTFVSKAINFKNFKSAYKFIQFISTFKHYRINDIEIV